MTTPPKPSTVTRRRSAAPPSAGAVRTDQWLRRVREARSTDTGVQVTDELVEGVTGTWPQVEKICLVVGEKPLVPRRGCLGDTGDEQQSLDPAQSGQAALGKHDHLWSCRHQRLRGQ